VDGTLGNCAHCGLPAPPGASFCCYGCELASRIAAEAHDDHARLHGTLTFSLVLAMVVMMLALFLYAEDVFDAHADLEMAWLRVVYRWASLVLTTPVMVLCGGPLLARAAGARRLSMDALIAVGALAAYGLSVGALVARRPAIYFDSAATALVLATLGRYLEATARSRASRSLGPLVEVGRRQVRADGRWLAPAEIRTGMRLDVEPEAVVPVDLRLELDCAEVDLAVISGEARPVVVRRGEVVPAGAVAQIALTGIALRTAEHSTLERLAALARSLAERPEGVLRWADRFARVLTPLVWMVAIATVVCWWRAASVATGVVAGLAVLLAACPCSYAIASPLVHWLTLRKAFGRGVLVRSANALEGLAHTRTVAFDKTGTLTRSQPRVASETLPAGVSRDEAMALVRALEEGAVHPVARALYAHAGAVTPAELRDRRVVPGEGVRAADGSGRPVTLGGDSEGAIVLRRDGIALASFVLAEELRPDAREAVAVLRSMGIRVVLLSGDHAVRVQAVAEALGIEARAGLSPEEKVGALRALGAGTAMVGDGVNDAPALAGRMTSFSLGEAAPLARGMAQVNLLTSDLRLVGWTIELARLGLRRMKWLIGVSTAYNLVFVSLAAVGALRPVWAGLSMLVSSLVALAFAASGGDAGEAEAPAVEAAAC
jgi:Cu2+-exporting ATPase